MYLRRTIDGDLLNWKSDERNQRKHAKFIFVLKRKKPDAGVQALP
jgi:hypothetical protein